MLFGIAGDPDAKRGGFGVLQLRIQVLPAVHVHNLLHQFHGMQVPTRSRTKGPFAPQVVAPQCQHVVNPQKTEVNQGIFDIVFRETAANQVRHYLNAVACHNRSRNPYGTGTFAHHAPFEQSVGSLDEFDLFTVVGDVDIGGVVGGQTLDGIEDGVDVVAFERRQQLEGEEGFSGGEFICNFHERSNVDGARVEKGRTN